MLKLVIYRIMLGSQTNEYVWWSIRKSFRSIILSCPFFFFFLKKILKQNFILINHLNHLIVRRARGSPPCWRVLSEKTSYLVDLVIYVVNSTHSNTHIHKVLEYLCPGYLDMIWIHCMQELLLGVLLCCNFIGLMKAENMQSLCTSLERGSLILVFFLALISVDKLLHFVNSPLLVW